MLGVVLDLSVDYIASTVSVTTHPVTQLHRCENLLSCHPATPYTAAGCTQLQLGDRQSFTPQLNALHSDKLIIAFWNHCGVKLDIVLPNFTDQNPS